VSDIFDDLLWIKRKLSEGARIEIWLTDLLPAIAGDGRRISVSILDVSKINESLAGTFPSNLSLPPEMRLFKPHDPASNQIWLMSWGFYRVQMSEIHLAGIPVFAGRGKRVLWGEIEEPAQ
jgi:hypothetical protein